MLARALEAKIGTFEETGSIFANPRVTGVSNSDMETERADTDRYKERFYRINLHRNMSDSATLASIKSALTNGRWLSLVGNTPLRVPI